MTPDDFVDSSVVSNGQLLRILGLGVVANFALGTLLHFALGPDTLYQLLSQVGLFRLRAEYYQTFSPISLAYYLSSVLVFFACGIALCMASTRRYAPKADSKKIGGILASWRGPLAACVLFLGLMVFPLTLLPDRPSELHFMTTFPLFPVVAVLCSFLVPLLYWPFMGIYFQFFDRSR